MRKLTQKLVLSVVTMALVVIALGTSTFAWFTLSDTANVGQFQAQVISGDGIQVSVDDVTYYNGLTSGQMMDYLFEGGFSYSTVPGNASAGNIVTTPKYTAFRFDNYTSLNGYEIFEIDGTTEADASKYIEFDLYFRSTDAFPIAWTNATMTGSGTWVADTTFTNAKGVLVNVGDSVSVNPADGARVSVTSGAVGSESSKIVEKIVDATNSISWATVGGTADQTNGFISYYNAINEVDWTQVSPTKPTTLLTSGLGADDVVVTLAETGVDTGVFKGMITVRVWIEGWDVNTFNQYFNSTLAVSLVFEKQSI